MSIGQQIKARRLALKLTQQQLADKVGVSKQYVSDIERGRWRLSIDTLQPFLTALKGELKIDWQPDIE